MATAKPQPAIARPPRPARRLALALALLGVVGLGLGWPRLTGRARLAAAEAARLDCACRYVANRSSQDCRQGTARLVWLSEDASGRTITARVPLLASERATLHEGAGCQLGPWRD